jgi:hypothetical protein
MSSHPDTFMELPDAEPLRIGWPTPNHFLFTDPDRFFARTRANPDYGKPGWTRDCGRRFHGGCDIAPLNVSPTGATTLVWFSECPSGREYPSEEPTFIPHDVVLCVAEGRVATAGTDAAASSLGRHVLVEHSWPVSRAPFYTLYGHLAEVFVTEGEAARMGRELGVMGQSSNREDARNWMAIAPHLHFEAWDGSRRKYDPLEFLKRYLPPA